MNGMAVSAEAGNSEKVVRADSDKGIVLSIQDSLVLAFFSVAYESAVILLRVRSRLTPR